MSVPLTLKTGQHLSCVFWTTLTSIVQEALNARFDQTLTKVHAPVLAIYGSKDEIVPAADNVPIARRTLAVNRGAKVVEFPDLDHGLRHVKTISILEQRYSAAIAAPEVINRAPPARIATAQRPATQEGSA